MPTGAVIEFRNITKRFGPTTAVNDLSFTVEPGRVTGFLGPNGAGKTTTLRMLLGLVTPTSGTATFGGLRYRDLPRPLDTVGAALEAASFHPGRTASSHLGVYTLAAGLPRTRVAEVLALVGLAEHASASAWPIPCSATPACSFSTSRSTASTPKASSGSAGSSATWQQRGARCW
jgi:ABC-2 type transport system ATP-binding protein